MGNSPRSKKSPIEDHLPPLNDQKQKEPVLQAERQKLYDLLMQVPGVVIILRGRDLVWEFVNPAALQIWHRKSSEDLLNKPYLETMPELRGTPIEKVLENIFKTGEPFYGRELYVPFDRNDDGLLEDAFFTFVYTPMRNAHNEVDGIMVFANDVTDQVLARQKVEQSEKHYRTLFNSIDEGFCIIEKVEGDVGAPLDFLYIEANAAFATQSGVSNVVGKTIRQVVPGETEDWFETYDTIARTGEPLRFERGLVTQGRVLELYAFRIEDETHRRVAVIFKDVTEQKRVEQLRDEHERELAVNEERQRLARELRDSVSQTLFSASLLIETLPGLWRDKPERALAQLDTLHEWIRGASAEMRALLHELRPESIVQSKLSILFTQLVYAMQARSTVAISVHTRGDDELPLPPAVHLVFYRIAQESMNNLLKHAHATNVNVRLRRTSSYTILMIRDNGRGFNTPAASSGFGLTIMQERANSVGAVLNIKSHVGNGTRVRLVWPVPAPV